MFHELKKQIYNILCLKENIPKQMAGLVALEESRGALISVRFRYVIWFSLFMSAIANLTNIDTLIGYYINFVALGLYLGNTLIHEYILKKKNSDWKTRYDFVSIFLDNFLVTMTIVNWYFVKGGGNVNFLIKNPLIIFYLLPLSLAIFQYRISLVAFSFLCFLFFYYLFFFISLQNLTGITYDWNEYVLTDKIIVSDLAVTKPLVFFTLAIALGYGIYRSLSMLQKFASSESQKTTLSRYFSPDLVTEIISDPDLLSKGKRQKVTILFSDIRNFTNFSESMDPEDLSQFLTEFRRRMVRAIFKFQGSLDKFIGDAVMATFGTPIVSSLPGEDSKNAVLAAKEMLAELNEFNEERKEKGQPPIQIGIGIHSGEVFFGSIGTEDRMEFTVIGDPVNTASRIESACKELKTPLLISEFVYKEIGGGSDWVEHGGIALSGKAQTINLFSLKS